MELQCLSQSYEITDVIVKIVPVLLAAQATPFFQKFLVMSPISIMLELHRLKNKRNMLVSKCALCFSIFPAGQPVRN